MCYSEWSVGRLTDSCGFDVWNNARELMQLPGTGLTHMKANIPILPFNFQFLYRKTSLKLNYAQNDSNTPRWTLLTNALADSSHSITFFFNRFVHYFICKSPKFILNLVSLENYVWMSYEKTVILVWGLEEGLEGQPDTGDWDCLVALKEVNFNLIMYLERSNMHSRK